MLHVVPDLMPYGLEKMVASLATLTDPDRFVTGIAALYDPEPGSLQPGLAARGIPVYSLGKKRGLDPRMFYRLSGVFRQFRPDVLHTHNYVMRYTMPASFGCGIPVMVHTIHNVADREVDAVGRNLQSWAFRGRVTPVSIAEEVSRSCERVYGMRDVPLIYNGIPVDRFRVEAGTREAWRRDLGFSDSDVLLTCVARFEEQKNHATLLQAFARGTSNLPAAKLILAGDGSLQGALEQQAASLGIANRVHFIGRRDDVPAVLAAADVFVLASLWEGNPLSVMEAMAAGLPVVVTRVGGVPELAEHGHCGLVVPPGDTDSLASAMAEVASNAGLRKRFGAAARARAEQKFDHRQMAAAYESLYQRELDSHFGHRVPERVA